MKRIAPITLSVLLAGAALLSIAGCRTQEHTQSASGSSYPLTKCVVSNDDLGDKPYVFTHNGQTVKLCCKDCLAKFNKDPEQYMAKINSAK